MNEQTPMKQDRAIDSRLLVHSIFHTIQGEGPFVGHPSVFVRLGGCNLQCPGCDTEYTSGSMRLPIPTIVGETKRQFWMHGTDKGLHAVDSAERPLVVITGGEPFRQQIWPLVAYLISEGFRVQIETNGTLYQDYPDYMAQDPGKLWKHITIVCSPKAGALNKKLTPFINAYKYVAKADSIAEDDGLPIWALDHPAAPRLARPPDSFARPVYLQPMDEQDDEKNLKNLQAVVSACKKHGHILCLQTHKIIGEQ